MSLPTVETAPTPKLPPVQLEDGQVPVNQQWDKCLPVMIDTLDSVIIRLIHVVKHLLQELTSVPVEDKKLSEFPKEMALPTTTTNINTAVAMMDQNKSNNCCTSLPPALISLRIL